MYPQAWQKMFFGIQKRNEIAIFAIALTTLLFTSLFTIVLSINKSYETYNFRQMGGYSHGSFKDVTEEQVQKLSAHPGVKASGKRIVCGFISDGVFGKLPAEVSYMDKNCSKWSYAKPTTGKEPEKKNEIAMDTTALELLGIKPELGAQVKINYEINNGDQAGGKQEDVFTLVGYWEFDDLMPVHYSNVFENYVKIIEGKCMENGMEAFRIDLNVMFPSTIHIEEQLQKIDSDLGYNWETRGEENSARIGVNWALTTSQVDSKMDPELIAAILTGIYARREFAVLQSVGMTNRQLKKMLVYEGMFYTLGAVAVALILSVVIGPLSGNMMENMFWFFSYHFTIFPVLCMIPVFALLGWLIPTLLYRKTAKESVVERLKDIE